MKPTLLQKFTPANWIQIVLLVITIIGGYFGIVARMDALENDGKRLKTRVEQMDLDGTKASQREIAKDFQASLANQQMISEAQKRVGNLELQNTDMVPKVARIDANVQWIMEWMKERRSK